MENLINQAIDEFAMLDKADKIVVGLSGGADSITLAHYLYSKGFEIVCCHINHLLRGEESERDERFVEAFCRDTGVALEVIRADVKAIAAQEGKTLEQAGRDVRYAELERIRQKHNADKIATAHTLSDNAETLLLNLTRGAALKGLCGIPPVRGRIIRPLIYCKREDIEEYCRRHSLDYVVDSTNLSDDFARNSIRLNVIPALKKINPAFERAAARTIKELRADYEYMESLLSENGLAVVDGALDAEALSKADKALQTIAVSKLLEQHSLKRSSGQISKIISLDSNCGRWQLDEAHLAVRRGGRLYIEQIGEAEYYETELVLGENILPFCRIYAELQKPDLKNDEKVYKKLLYIALDYDKIKGKLILRQRKEGDKIRLAGRNGTRSVKKLFIEQKLSPYEKSTTPLICDDDGVAAIIGVGVASRVAVDADTKRIIIIEKDKTQGDLK